MLTFAACVLVAVLAPQADLSRQIGELVEKLRSERIEERGKAELKLIELGPGARSEVQALKSSGDAELQARAERILKYYRWGLTPDTRQTLDGLIARSHLSAAEDPGTASGDAFILEDESLKQWKELGTRGVPYLLDLHHATPHGPRRGQILRLAAISRDRSVLEAAVADLESAHPATRVYATRVCGRLGDASTVPKLAEHLNDKPRTEGVQDLFQRDYDVAQNTAWAIQEIVGFPIDPEQWVDNIYPYHNAHHGISLDLRKFQGWWERNSSRRTLEEWRRAAREEALRWIDTSIWPKDWLSGCMILMALGGEDDKLCRTLFKVCRTVPAKQEDYQLRATAIGFFRSRPDPGDTYQGRPWERVEDVLGQILSDEGRAPEWTAALGLAWFLFGGPHLQPVFFGKQYSLSRLRPIIFQRLESQDPGVRCLAALLLAFMGEPKAEAALIYFLQTALDDGARERHPWLHGAAAWMETGRPGGLFQKSALEALERIGTDASRQVLKAYTRTPTFCLAACRALARRGDTSIEELLTPYLDASELRVPDGDQEAWNQSFNRESNRQTAFLCLYLLRKETAMEWWRKRYPGEKRLTFFQGDAAALLVEKSDPLAVELWLTPNYGEAVWQKMPQFQPEVLMSTLIALASQGSSEARRRLGRLAPGHGLESKSSEALNSWWETSKGNFEIDPAGFMNQR
jgi:HEAT repeat protein